ncbi:DgyrCDS2259 [Dimorphilus gyrociliatus]|uniref:Arsenite methyltransferase n=1 Tax=Dimorphilus gyrociliatus TaxID=2664684 RepID=A0A7I8VCI5_9ANNE|nr:DgyrCDS2259 [Dimorphilus gyrociliatus]
MSDGIHDSVKDYYGKVLQKSGDLKTTACTTSENESMSKSVKHALSLLSDEVHEKYYGCGIVLPPALENCTVLDLGCGAGRDCFCLSKLIGENGHVTGLDMTQEQLDVANRNISFHTEKFGYSKPNIDFKKGYIEKLTEAGIKASTFDVIVSNCVVNLSPDKEAVLSEAYKVLKEGGEFYFSDVYADRRLSEEILKNEVLWGECIAGALYWEDLINLAIKVGFTSPLLVSASYIDIKNKELKKILGCAQFISATYRLFKIPKGDFRNSIAVYKGGIEDFESNLKFDYNHSFQKGIPVPVTGELSGVLKGSRYSKFFTVEEQKHSSEIINPFHVAGKSSGGCCGKPKQEEKKTKSCCSGEKCN